MKVLLVTLWRARLKYLESLELGDNKKEEIKTLAKQKYKENITIAPNDINVTLRFWATKKPISGRVGKEHRRYFVCYYGHNRINDERYRDGDTVQVKSNESSYYHAGKIYCETSKSPTFPTYHVKFTDGDVFYEVPYFDLKEEETDFMPIQENTIQYYDDDKTKIKNGEFTVLSICLPPDSDPNTLWFITEKKKGLIHVPLKFKSDDEFETIKTKLFHCFNCFVLEPKQVRVEDTKTGTLLVKPPTQKFEDTHEYPVWIDKSLEGVMGEKLKFMMGNEDKTVMTVNPLSTAR